MSYAEDRLVQAARESVAAFGRPFVSLFIVGSVTTREYSPRRRPVPDLDLLVVVDGAVVTADESHELRRDIVRACGRSRRVGARLRATQEISEFDVHMASWGYDLREAQCLAGIPIDSFVGTQPPRIPRRYIFRNLLCQLWRSVAEADFGGGAAYRLSRDICEFMNLYLLSGETFCARLRRRLLTFEMLRPTICCRAADTSAARLAVNIRLGDVTCPVSASVLRSLRQLREGLLIFLSSQLDEVQGDPWIERWVPGPVVSSLGALSCLDAAATALFLDDIPEVACECVGAASAHLSKIGLGSSPRARPDDHFAEFSVLRRRFAAAQMERCDLARRDIRHHLRHLLDVPENARFTRAWRSALCE